MGILAVLLWVLAVSFLWGASRKKYAIYIPFILVIGYFIRKSDYFLGDYVYGISGVALIVIALKHIKNS